MVDNSTYKKYIEMFTGLVLILIIVNPIIRFLKVDSMLDFQIQRNQLYEMTEAQSQDIMVAELKQGDVLISQYKDMIKKDVKTQMENNQLYPVTIDVAVNEELESEQFGTVESIDVEFQKEKEENKTEEEQDYIVHEVEIPAVQIGNKETIVDKIDNGLETKDIKVQIANKFGISVEQVSMHLVKDGKGEED